MPKLALLVGFAVLLVASSASADTVLHLTSFDVPKRLPRAMLRLTRSPFWAGRRSRKLRISEGRPASAHSTKERDRIGVTFAAILESGDKIENMRVSVVF